MEKNEYKSIYLNEKNHWWYSGMRSSFLILIKDYLRNRKNLTILDAGCGIGYNIKIMQKFGSIYGVDNSSEAIKFCRLNKLKNIKKASIEKIPFNNNTFDLVTSFEVLYHKGVKDDKKALIKITKDLNIKIEKMTYLNSAMFLPLLILKFLEKDKVESDIKKTNKFINRLLKTYLTTEGYFARKINIPFGTSIFMIAKKTKS